MVTRRRRRREHAFRRVGGVRSFKRQFPYVLAHRLPQEEEEDAEGGRKASASRRRKGRGQSK